MRGTERTRLLGKNLQTLRKAAGYKSARVFAEHLGINVSTYTEYEQGRTPFTLEQAWMFADAIGCTLDELCGRSVAPSKPEQITSEVISKACESLNDEGVSRLIKDAEILVNSGMFDKE